MAETYILHSTKEPVFRAILFDHHSQLVAQASQPSHYPQSGCGIDPNDIQ